MDIFPALLGAGVVVLILIALCVVSSRAPDTGPSIEEGERMQPDLTSDADQFSDEFTSATADLSAGGVATAVDAMQHEAQSAEAPEPTPNVQPTAYAAAGEPWSSPTIAREGATDVAVTPAPVAAASESREWSQTASAGTESRGSSEAGSWSAPQAARSLARPRTIGLGAAIVLAIASAVVGAWLYARWQRRRNAPINRARRSVRQAQKGLRSGLRERQKELRSSRFPVAVRL
jgi:hypothetical protein